MVSSMFIGKSVTTALAMLVALLFAVAMTIMISAGTAQAKCADCSSGSGGGGLCVKGGGSTVKCY